MTVPFTYNSPRFSEILFFTFYFPSQAIFRRKKEPKLFGFKNVVARGIRKFLSFVIRQISSKISEKQYSSLCNFEKTQVPQDDQTDTNFTRRLECISRDLKSTLVSLKRKPSLGAPINNLFLSPNGKTSQQNGKTCAKYD